MVEWIATIRSTNIKAFVYRCICHLCISQSTSGTIWFWRPLSNNCALRFTYPSAFTHEKRHNEAKRPKSQHQQRTIRISIEIYLLWYIYVCVCATRGQPLSVPGANISCVFMIELSLLWNGTNGYSFDYMHKVHLKFIWAVWLVNRLLFVGYRNINLCR